MAHQGEWTHCRRGHEFTVENTYVCPEGWRRCRRCKADARELSRIRRGDPKLRAPERRVTYDWFTVDELAAVDTEDDSWRSQALCATDNPSPEHNAKWFTGRGHNQKLADAVAICEQCPVRLECLAFGVWEKFGVWGGVSERARRNLRVQLNQREESAA